MPEPRITEKSWNRSMEPDVMADWKNDTRFDFDEKSKKPLFSIDTPPPYVNAPIHMGHATTYTLMDFFARFQRMNGKEVLFPIGLDRNGLPIEAAAEKKFDVRAHEVTREKFLQMCEEMLESASDQSLESFSKLGIRFSGLNKGTALGDIYYTDSNDYRTLSQGTFIDLWNRGLIYEDTRVNNFDPGTRTTIADAEIEYVEKETMFNDIVFTCKETGEELIIGTTRPELVCTCGMVVFNSDDERYAHLAGKTAVTPIYGKEIPIKAHPLAKIDKGTGLVMMCLAGDYTDIQFFREQKLVQRVAIGTDGKMNDVAGFLQGLPVKKAREKMIETLKEKGLLKNQKKVMHRTPISERSKAEIEFVELPELYLKQLEFKQELVRMANEVQFFNADSRKILLSWIDSVSIDWPISRKRFYATEVPLWYCTKCNHPQLAGKGTYVKPWKEKPPIEKCPKCSNKEWRGDERVLDTWFDSSISPLYVMGYERFPEFFKQHPQCTLRPQGKEIVRTWLYYTLLRGYLLTGKTIFQDVYIHHHVLDEKGIKMSKSLGNIIDPMKVHERFGAEPFRLWAASEGNMEQTDFRCSMDRIDSHGKVLTKLWNVARFISQFDAPQSFDPQKVTNELDRWMMGHVDQLVVLSQERMNAYDFYHPAMQARQCLYDFLASNYLELVKSRAYNADNQFSKADQQSATGTLYYCLKQLLLVMAPIIPFATQKLYQSLFNENVHHQAFPKPIGVTSSLPTDVLLEQNSKIWTAKKEKGLSLNAPIEEWTFPVSLKPIENDLKSCHQISKIIFQ